MNFEYTIDPNADEPIMMVDRHIGNDEEDGEGIMGDKFAREILFLDTLNKSKIHVWINSPGGSVIDGEMIFGSILKTKTKVDTHCVGVAASIAFPIFLAGRNRYMMDYAKCMTHPVSGGTDTKAKMALEDAVVKMIASRSIIGEDLIKQLMAKTTWMSATDCRDLGLCEIEHSGDLNKKRVATNNWEDYRYITNKVIEEKKPKKNISMKGIANKLNLNDEASEKAIVGEIEKLQNSISVTNEAYNKAKKELEEAENKFNELKAKFDNLSKEMNTVNEAKNKAEKEAVTAKAESLINEGVKVGKIQNEAKAIEAWRNKFESDFEGTKSLLEAIPASRKGAVIETGRNGADNDKALTAVISNTMHEIRNKLKID